VEITRASESVAQEILLAVTGALAAPVADPATVKEHLYA
jgi:hypothetical protein